MHFLQIVVLVYGFGVLQSLGCNSKSFSELPRRTDDNPKGWYKFLQPLTHKCDVKYEDFSMSNITSHIPTSHIKTCANVLKGTNIMQHGFNYLPQNLNRNDVAISMRCEGRTVEIDGILSSLPNGMLVKIINQTQYQVNHYDKQIISTQWLNAIGSEIEEHLNTRLEAHTKLLQKKNKESIETIQVQYITYSTQMENAEPSRVLLFCYRSLHENLYHNISSYLEFVGRFGSHIRVNSLHGGIIEFIPVKSIKRDTSQWINSIAESKISKNEVIFSVGGNLNHNISQWKKSLEENSLVLKSTIIPIYDFVSPNLTSQKKESLRQMVDYIIQNVKLQYILNALQTLNSRYYIADFMRRAIKAHQNYVCPSQSLNNIIQNWVLNADNINLNRFTISCTHDRWLDPSKGEEYVITRIFYLLPGLCFTKEVQFSTCVNVHLTLPVGIRCVKFYTKTGCSGEIYAEVSSDRNLADALINGKSFAYC